MTSTATVEEKCSFPEVLTETGKVNVTRPFPYKRKLKDLRGNMLRRCYTPGTRRYERYGGRGIRVCDEWRIWPDAFYAWALENGYKPSLTIERKDVNGDYCPENCCFATVVEQANNRTSNVFLEWNGKRQTITQWAKEIGVKYRTLTRRMAKGWSVDRIFTQPFREDRSAL